MQTKIIKLVTHNRPHLDECLVILFIKRYYRDQAEKIWPGSTTARIEFFRTGVHPRGMSWRDFPDRLFIGCAKGSPLDEHWSNLATDKQECAATLAAKLLGVSDRLELKNPLRHILNVDKGGTKNRRLVSAVLNILYTMSEPPSTEAILDWVDDACSAEFNDQIRCGGKDKGHLTIDRAYKMMREQGGERSKRADRWFNLATRAIKEREIRFSSAYDAVKNIKPEKFDSAFGNLTLMTVTGDNDQLTPACFSLGGVDVVVHHRVKRTAGTVQIIAKAGSGICLSKVAALIRAMELRKRGKPIPEDEEILYEVDIIEEDGIWHLVDTKNKNNRMLFNGSASHPHVESTVIDPVTLGELVKRGLQKY